MRGETVDFYGEMIYITVQQYCFEIMVTCWSPSHGYHSFEDIMNLKQRRQNYLGQLRLSVILPQVQDQTWCKFTLLPLDEASRSHQMRFSICMHGLNMHRRVLHFYRIPDQWVFRLYFKIVTPPLIDHTPHSPVPWRADRINVGPNS